jgi:hypothetical protein
LIDATNLLKAAEGLSALPPLFELTCGQQWCNGYKRARCGQALASLSCPFLIEKTRKDTTGITYRYYKDAQKLAKNL